MEQCTLAKGKTMTIPGPCCVTVHVTSGALWATASPAKGDALLQPGKAGALVSKGPVVLEALSDAEFCWSTTACGFR